MDIFAFARASKNSGFKAAIIFCAIGAEARLIRPIRRLFHTFASYRTNTDFAIGVLDGAIGREQNQSIYVES